MPFPSRIRLETRLPAALSEQDRGWTRRFGKLEGRDWLPTIIVVLLILSLWIDAVNRRVVPRSQSFDRRGNEISRTDLDGNTFSTTYDGLNRVKQTTGPAASSPSGLGSTAQQSTTHRYGAAGVTETVTDALQETTATTYDALERPIQVIVSNANGTVASNTSYGYSPNHESVTTIAGSGTNGVAVSNTLYTDTFGNPVLLQHADGTYQATAYDANGNKTFFQDEQQAQTSWTYDALNHPTSETLPGGALISLSCNAAGEVLSRQMPESQTETTTYDSAGRKTGEELSGCGGAITRNYGYSYYTPSYSGTGGATGLLESVTDPRGFTTTTTYDPCGKAERGLRTERGQRLILDKIKDRG